MPKYCNKLWGTSNKINGIPVYSTSIYSCTESFLDNDYISENTIPEVEKINTMYLFHSFDQIRDIQII